MNPLQERMLDVKMTCRQGDVLFGALKFDDAKRLYWEHALKLVGPNVRIPAIGGVGDGGVRSELYTNLDPFDRANLMGCCNGIAKCLIREGDIESALAWLEEVVVLYRNTYFTSDVPLYDWKNYNILLPELTFRRLVGLSTMSDVFLSLGNTGTATHRRWIAGTSIMSLPQSHHTPAIKAQYDAPKARKLIELHHPDPALTPKLELKVSGLQLRGSWAKLPIKPPAKLPRFSFTSFIWKSRLYVAGGQKDSLGPFYRDLWCLDLLKLDAWRPLPDYPIPTSSTQLFLNWEMIVYGNKAYLFTGRPQIDYFDLVTEKWGYITTTYKRTRNDELHGITNKWPYPEKVVSHAAQQISQGKLYVFGGKHGTTNIGCNLFMELDLETKAWRRLSGHVMPPPNNDYALPGPRKAAASWISKDKNRFYLLFGQCDRNGAYLKNEPHGDEDAYQFEDMWSWDIKTEKWRGERLAGNPPCPRTEMACSYNKHLNRVIVFGGYNPTLPTTVVADNTMFNYSYFADTFMYIPPDPAFPPVSTPMTSPTQTDVGVPKWKQILTRGFPTYRCQAQLSTDPDTGKMYLFGGFTNKSYVPCRNGYITKSFGDVWQLRIDEPGGDFEGVDVEEEARTARAGPWQRCFACGDAGPWRKCGGTCKGQAFFCRPECLKDGWKEHKQMHNCQKGK